MITSTLVLYVKRLSKNNQQNHIQYDHQELYYDNSDKYIAHNCQIDHEKTCIECKKCYKNFQTKTKIKNNKKRNIAK